MKKRRGICGKARHDGTRCTNAAGCRVPHPTVNDSTSSAAVAAAQSVVAEQSFGGDRDEGRFDYILDNEDYAGMAESVSADARASLKTAQPVLDDRGGEIDSRGYWLTGNASDEVRALTHSAAADAPAEQIETVCVVASELLHAMERDEEYGQYGTSPDMTQVRQTLCCVAAHPNASSRACRQAVRAEGKYSAREVLRRSRDPEMLEFAMDQTGEGVWHAVEDDGRVNPALRPHRLDNLIEMTDRIPPLSEDDAKYTDGIRASLRTHPSLTDEQRSILANR